MRRAHNWIEGVPLRSSPPHASPPSPKSLPLMWLPEGLRRSKVNSAAAHHRAAEILDPIQTDLLPQSQLGRRPKEVIIHRMCMSTWKVLLLHWVIAPVLSQHQVLHDLEVGYVGFIINACAGA
jgi:hypothetical protein